MSLPAPSVGRVDTTGHHAIRTADPQGVQQARSIWATVFPKATEIRPPVRAKRAKLAAWLASTMPRSGPDFEECVT